MQEPRRELLKAHQEDFLKVSQGHLDVSGRYLPGDQVAERLDIGAKTLVTLAASDEFELGRVAGRVIVDKESLLNYLDKVHFMGATQKNAPPAVDAKGRIKAGLTLVPEHHETVPVLKPIQDFAERIAMDKRSFLRHCDVGTFRHYRIGTTYKMSEEDWEKSLAKITRTGKKSNRGRGRPSNVKRRVAEAAGMEMPPQPAPLKERLTPEALAELLDPAQGVSRKEISERFGTSPQRINQLVAEYRKTHPDLFQSVPLKRETLKERLNPVVLAELLAPPQSLSQIEIGQRFGTSPQRIQQLVTEYRKVYPDLFPPRRKGRRKKATVAAPTEGVAEEPTALPPEETAADTSKPATQSRRGRKKTKTIAH